MAVEVLSIPCYLAKMISKTNDFEICTVLFNTFYSISEFCILLPILLKLKIDFNQINLMGKQCA